MTPPRPDVATERRAEIIEAALSCFMRKGYANTTMDDIVAESGLSKGTLYWYFDGKEDLFEAALLSIFDSLAQKSLEDMEAQTAADQQLRAGARSLVDLAREMEGYFGLMVEFWSQNQRQGEAAIEVWGDMLTQYQQAIAAVFERGDQSGTFRTVDADALAWMMMAAYDGLAAYQMIMPDLDLERISETFIETLLKGLSADESGS